MSVLRGLKSSAVVICLIGLMAFGFVVTPAGATSGVRLVYVSKPLAARESGEVVAAVPPGRDCRLTVRQGSHIEARSSQAHSSVGEIDYTWSVPPVVSPGSRTATVSCAGGASASASISVKSNSKGAERPVALLIHVTPIRATDPPAVSGKGGGTYPPYGSVILSASSWFGGRGVNVYSDGSDGGGGFYQCVELANRFMTSEHFGPAIWGNAYQLFADAQPGYYVTHANGTGYIPVPGDLVVFGGETYGHVAIVDSVAGSVVNLVEQNASPTGRTTISLTGSTLGGIYSLYVIGVVHAKANTPATSPPVVTPPVTPLPPVTPPPSSPTLDETTGGTTNTWTNYADAGGSAGPVISAQQTVVVSCRIQGFAVGDGNTWWYQIASSPWSSNYFASADAFYNNGATSGSLVGTPFYDPNVPVCSGSVVTTTPTTPTTTPIATTYAETTGGVAHTWTNYVNAGGTEGPSISSNQSVQIACRTTGFKVSDGNTWWYQIASSPWNSTYWVSADAFYNNGATSGSLVGTPFFDPNVPVCGGSVTTTTPTTTPTTPTTTPIATTYADTTGGVAHTWTNYVNAGGTEGPSISSNQSVQIACRTTGFKVSDGNTWWYQIASSPWNSTYWVSADAFYNNGATSGSLVGTPFFDPNVPTC